MAKVVLDFERPIQELEKKIDEMRKYADNLDIAEEITTLEKKVDRLTGWCGNPLSREGSSPRRICSSASCACSNPMWTGTASSSFPSTTSATPQARSSHRPLPRPPC